MVDIAATLATVSQVIGLAKDLRDIERGVDEAAYKVQIANLMSSMADVKIALLEAQEEMAAKDKKVAELRKAFEFKATLVEYHGFKYEKFDDGRPKGVPFCPRCEQNMGRYYRISEIRGDGIKWICPECKTEFGRVTSFLWERAKA